MERLSVLRIVVKLLLPYILLLGLYVQFHGDYGFVLYGLIFGVDAARRVAPPRLLESLMALGLLLYIGVGIDGMLAGAEFLNYNVLDRHDPTHGQHRGIFLIELGVGTTVAATMTAIFFAFAGRERT